MVKLSKEEYSVGMAFLVKPWKKLTIKEILALSEKNSRSYVNNSLNKLEKGGIIRKDNVGKTIVYEFILNQTASINYLGLLEEHNFRMTKIPQQILENLRKKVPTKFFIMMVTGSYANGKSRKDSDLDVVIICDNSLEPKKIISELKHEGELSIPKVHLYVFKEKEFLEMLINKEENYGKEIVRNHKIFIGATNYYLILKEALDHGFKD